MMFVRYSTKTIDSSWLCKHFLEIKGFLTSFWTDKNVGRFFSDHNYINYVQEKFEAV